MDTILQKLGSWEKLQNLALDPFNLVVLFLFAVGIVLKQTQKVPDWAIIFCVPLIGAGISIAYLHFETGKLGIIAAGMLGYFYGMISTHVHGMLKQLLQSPVGAKVINWPLVGVVAGLVGVEIPQAEPKK